MLNCRDFSHLTNACWSGDKNELLAKGAALAPGDRKSNSNSNLTISTFRHTASKPKTHQHQWRYISTSMFGGSLLLCSGLQLVWPSGRSGIWSEFGQRCRRYGTRFWWLSWFYCVLLRGERNPGQNGLHSPLLPRSLQLFICLSIRFSWCLVYCLFVCHCCN